MNWSPQTKREAERLRKAAEQGGKAGREAAKILAQPIADAFKRAEKTVAYWKELSELAGLEIQRLKAEVEEERARLDWLQKHGFKFVTMEGTHYWASAPTFKTLRQVIDEQRKETK